MIKPELSVVMSCFNCEGTVGEAIESILNQTYRRLEFICIDDGSSDSTLQILHNYADSDERIKILVNPKNIGLAASLNIGINAATSPLIARMDADDKAFPQRFEKQMRFLDNHPEVDILGGGIIQINDLGESLGVKLLPQEHNDILKNIFRKPLVYHPTIVIRKRVYEKFGFYNPKITWAEDADLWYRIYDKITFHNLQEPILLYTIKNRLTYRQFSGNLKVKLSNLVKRKRLLGYLPRITLDTIRMSFKMIKYSL